MAKTLAQRQKEYRDKRQFAGIDGNGERRLNTWVSTRASLALERLAKSHGVTKRDMIERLVVMEEEKLLKSMNSDSPEWRQYFSELNVTQ
jgi:hypothetical protein